MEREHVLDPLRRSIVARTVLLSPRHLFKVRRATGAHPVRHQRPPCPRLLGQGRAGRRPPLCRRSDARCSAPSRDPGPCLDPTRRPSCRHAQLPSVARVSRSDYRGATWMAAAGSRRRCLYARLLAHVCVRNALPYPHPFPFSTPLSRAFHPLPPFFSRRIQYLIALSHSATPQYALDEVGIARFVVYSARAPLGGGAHPSPGVHLERELSGSTSGESSGSSSCNL